MVRLLKTCDDVQVAVHVSQLATASLSLNKTGTTNTEV